LLASLQNSFSKGEGLVEVELNGARKIDSKPGEVLVGQNDTAKHVAPVDANLLNNSLDGFDELGAVTVIVVLLADLFGSDSRDALVARNPRFIGGVEVGGDSKR
jgi:hypothetical protein